MNKEYYNGFLRPIHLTAKNTGLRQYTIYNIFWLQYIASSYSKVLHNSSQTSE